MSHWKLSKSWVIILSPPFLLGALILYIGYRSYIVDPSRELPHTITNEVAQTVVAQNLQDSDASLANPISLNQNQQFQAELKLVFGQKNKVRKPLELKDFQSPVQGKSLRSIGNYYSEAFGSYVFHAGVDYALAEGTVIRAIRGGNVVLAGPDPILGQKVTLDYGEGWLVTYGGLDNLRVQEGEVVETLDALGQVGYFPGVEGETNQTQLHYEVWHDGQVQKP